MDAISVVYYAIVCGLLAGFVPAGWRMPVRFGIGVAVGVVAATVLPLLRGAF